MRRAGRKVDYTILFTFLILLLGVGLTALASASSDLGQSQFGDPYHFLKDQMIFGVGVGLAAFLAGYAVNYRLYKKFAPVILLGSLVLLFLLFTPLGISEGGAPRWIPVGPVTFQPSELLKLTVVLYLAAWLSGSKSSREKSFFEGFVPFLSIVGLIALPLLFQRSTSAAIIIVVIALAIYMASGARWSFLGLIGLMGALILAGFIISTPYRLERVQSFLDPTADVQGSAYQINQALTVIGSGGLTGVGYGQSNIKAFLPERISDSIFAVIAQEFGYIGSVLVIGLFFVLVTRGFILSKRTRDKFGKLLLVGFSTAIGLQAFIHIASASALIPVTGVPLPFISHGNFSLVVFMAMVGIMLNVHRNS